MTDADDADAQLESSHDPQWMCLDGDYPWQQRTADRHAAHEARQQGRDG